MCSPAARDPVSPAQDALHAEASAEDGSFATHAPEQASSQPSDVSEDALHAELAGSAEDMSSPADVLRQQISQLNSENLSMQKQIQVMADRVKTDKAQLQAQVEPMCSALQAWRQEGQNRSQDAMKTAAAEHTLAMLPHRQALGSLQDESALQLRLKVKNHRQLITQKGQGMQQMSFDLLHLMGFVSQSSTNTALSACSRLSCMATLLASCFCLLVIWASLGPFTYAGTHQYITAAATLASDAAALGLHIV